MRSGSPGFRATPSGKQIHWAKPSVTVYIDSSVKRLGPMAGEAVMQAFGQWVASDQKLPNLSFDSGKTSTEPKQDGMSTVSYGKITAPGHERDVAITITYSADKTGEIRWETKRPKVNWAHSTPILAAVNNKTQLITATHNGPQGIDPTTGEIIWYYHDSKQIGDTVSPIVRDGLCYVDSGRGGNPGVAIDATGAGDVSKTNLKWKTPSVPSSTQPLGKD